MHAHEHLALRWNGHAELAELDDLGRSAEPVSHGGFQVLPPLRRERQKNGVAGRMWMSVRVTIIACT